MKSGEGQERACRFLSSSDAACARSAAASFLSRPAAFFSACRSWFCARSAAAAKRAILRASSGLADGDACADASAAATAATAATPLRAAAHRPFACALFCASFASSTSRSAAVARSPAFLSSLRSRCA